MGRSALSVWLETLGVKLHSSAITNGLSHGLGWLLGGLLSHGLSWLHPLLRLLHLQQEGAHLLHIHAGLRWSHRCWRPKAANAARPEVSTSAMPWSRCCAR